MIIDECTYNIDIDTLPRTQGIFKITIKQKGGNFKTRLERTEPGELEEQEGGTLVQGYFLPENPKDFLLAERIFKEALKTYIWEDKEKIFNIISRNCNSHDGIEIEKKSDWTVTKYRDKVS